MSVYVYVSVFVYVCVFLCVCENLVNMMLCVHVCVHGVHV